MVLEIILPAAFVLLFNVLPGALLSLAFFRGLPLGVFSKAMLGALFGLLLPPILSFSAFVLFGAKYSFVVVLASSLLLWLLAALALYWRGMLSFKLFERRGGEMLNEASTLPYRKAIPKYGALLILFAILVLSFHVRYSTAAAYNFFEFDPVYYNHVSEILFNTGEIPALSYEVYWPLGRSIRDYPVVHYLTVGWMHAATALSGLAPSKEFIVAFSQLYPPLVALFMCFLAYLLFKELFSELVGIIAAAVFAFMPQLVKKLAAGVSELQPFGIFSVVFIFAAYALYLRQRDPRLAALAGFAVFASLLGSGQAIWPLLVLAVSMLFISMIDFRLSHLDSRSLLGECLILLGGVAAAVLFQAFKGGSVFEIPNSVTFIFGAVASHALLWLYQTYLLKRVSSSVPEERQRKYVPLALLLLGVLAVLLVPALNAKVSGYMLSATQFAVADAALSKTIAEENPTTPQVYPSSFGPINPELVLTLAFLVVCSASVFNFFRKNRLYGLLALAVLLLVTVFSAFLESLLKALVKGGAFGNAASVADFISTSDVFIFTVVSVALLFLDSLLNGADNRELIFLSFAVFPVSYIGLRKLKFIVHLGVSLSLALPLLLGQGKRVLDYFQLFLAGESDKRMLGHASTFVILVIGLAAGLALAGTLQQSMSELEGTRIPQDWLDAYAWMASNPNMTETKCVAEYGWDCRVLSWWDYGHWTTFFGGKKSVLDPSNSYAAFDQEVAKAFVDGNPADLKYTASYHQATHILVDADLIGKWGALVFLSGTCSKKEAPTCFDTPPIDFRTGAGQSRYEAEHYFEYMQPAGQCPQGVSPVALPAYQSQLTGATYCLSKSHILLLTQDGLAKNFQRPYLLVGRDNVDPSNIQANYSYLFDFGDTLINVNPDISYAGMSNSAINAAFARMYFFERLPGVELAYRSPNSQVKVFKITKGGPLLP